ncbi:ATP-dependent zinc metalloprotease FtsH [Gilliamella sp. B3791]|nr:MULTISPECIES: ATP-dependent zinc metalloprotease FtsH [unclassified Gilliamella]MCX8713220.1 ATP-dependent zinc metalloprotease FtsH [Gilliamella sp. B3468]MCX8728584.1 ATP-dependent zinc metalloprotease FtsH [Gilliamella sp. B2838]MCX8731121.1 ATP-dependent zinc metalloprotease FtsH [Gilliamella sp. B2969]MCX8752296.1 ATP-dependent zinc metalloprotease FtsH [Gilliamella sp. B3464]MCX8643159.1 ATP-dependent zinc metalloprotease FtsH [Gilliamella sp. B3835]
MVKNLLIWGVIAVVLIAVFNQFSSISNSGPQVNYTQFNSDITSGKLQEVHINGREIVATTKGNGSYVTYIPYFDEKLMDDLVLNKVAVYGSPDEKPSLLVNILISWFPIILLIGFWIFIMRQMQGGGKGGPMSVGKSKAKMLTPDQVKTKFTDVAGSEEAKQEVTEVVDFLRDPGKYQKLGGRIPKGILMVGPPGTGKTLLAKAIAGEANVPFFSISGSDFVEMFVGVGASRVRDLFEQARKHSPCIIFIDEIDAVGRKRGAGSMGGHDEREQTLNQMLVEMDGFEANSGIIIIAATNRVDILDPALLRPGRFDRQVQIGLPDMKGREQILAVHVRKVPLGSDVNLSVLARGTPGYSGAELANLVNEAALFAARRNKRLVTMDEFEEAKDKINMGTERRSLTMTKEQLISTAYHEAGHAIIGYLMPDHDPIHKVTIIPRGRALGVTFFLPEGDRVSESREKLEGDIATLYGGRLAEELIYGVDKVSTGASNDIKVATQYARAMVTQWGFSDRLGPLFYEMDDNSSYGRPKDISDETARIIDEEVKKIIDRNFERARKILTENMDVLHAMKDALMKYETIGAKQVADLIARRPITAPDDWTESDEKAANQIPNEGSDIPPQSES